MPAGGKREGAGRKKGSLTQKTREIAEQAAEHGITPLEVMLRTMRALWENADAAEKSGDEGQTRSIDMRLQAVDVAMKAAPFMHPKLSNIEMRANVEESVVFVVGAQPVSVEEWAEKHGAENG